MGFGRRRGGAVGRRKTENEWIWEVYDYACVLSRRTGLVWGAACFEEGIVYGMILMADAGLFNVER